MTDLGSGADRRAQRARGDRGAGIVGTIAGITVFLAFLLFAVQLLVNLYTASVVTSVAYDGAATVAGYGIDHTDPGAVAVAAAREETRMRDLLGGYEERVSFDWSRSSSSQIVLEVRAENPSFLLASLGGVLPFTTIEREIIVRVEESR